MKRLFLILLLLTFTLIAFSQEERIIKRVELQSGISLSGYVTTQSDGTVMIETADGDVFVYSQSEIRRIINQDHSVSDDNNNNRSEIVYKQGRFLKYSDSKEPLGRDDFSQFQLWEEYEHAQRQMLIGGRLLGWGITFAVLGAGLQVLFPISSKRLEQGKVAGYEIAAHTMGQVFLPSGGIMILSGAVLRIVGNVTITNIKKSMNQAYSISLDFGAQQYGIGLALNF